MVPLPPKVYLSGEMAESAAHVQIRAQGTSPQAPPEWKQLAASLVSGTISLRTFLRSNLGYKQAIALQGRGDAVAELLRLARLPHWLWVVEAHDRWARVVGRPSVLAEFVYDSTSGDRQPLLCAVSLPGVSAAFPPDEGQQRE